MTAGDVKANTFLNWPMQAHGAEMMRIASILAVERDIKLCAPIHDALLIEAPSDQNRFRGRKAERMYVGSQ